MTIKTPNQNQKNTVFHKITADIVFYLYFWLMS